MDDLFDSVVASGPGGEAEGGPGPTEEGSCAALTQHGAAEAMEMFGSVAAVYVRPVRQFVELLKDGPTSTEWIEICLPAVATVARSASSMGLEELVPPLDNFGSLLGKASDGDGKAVEGEIRDAILQAYSQLAGALPEAFAGDGEIDEKDSIIVHSLLRQVPDVGKVTLDKIFAAGLTVIEMLERASPEDLAVTTGISAHLSERICRAVQDYRRERQTLEASNSSNGWLRLLRRVLAELEEHHEAFQGCAGRDDERPEDAVKRKGHRRARQKAALKTSVLLAETGNVRLVDEMQRLSFERRIERLREFLASLGGMGGQEGAEARAQAFSRGVAEHG